MNSDQFFREVMESEICPKNFAEIYQQFKKIQKAALDTLIEFHRVCEKNNITYQLAFGSLLGAIRDGGQIPWDYDIDVFVAHQDKKNLIKALEKDLDNKFYFYCPESNKECRHVIMRLAPQGYRTEALHVDVFYYVGTPNDEKERELYVQKIKKLSRARFSKLVNPKEEAAGSWKRFIKLSLIKIPVLFKNIDKLEKDYEKLCDEYNLENPEYCVSADSFADWYNFPTYLFKDTKLIETNCGVFRIPVKYEEMLTITYKEYSSIPNLESRIEEVMHTYKRMEHFNLNFLKN